MMNLKQETEGGSRRPEASPRPSGNAAQRLLALCLEISASLCLLATPLWPASPAALYELANDKVLVAVDSAGNLLELTNRQTGHHYLSGRPTPPWRMYYRLGSTVTGALDLEVDP